MTDLDFVIPDGIEPVVGWRAWRIYPGPVLHSATQWAFWPPGKRMVAHCNKPHVPPDETCACGLYAARDRSHLYSMNYPKFEMDGIPVAVGEVYMWGGIIEGGQGWRGQYAYPKRVLVPFAAYRSVRLLRRRYGVPVIVENTLKEWNTPNRGR